MQMTEEHKQKLREARARAAEARKNAVDAEAPEPVKYGGAEASEIETLRAELAALKEKTREKAAHEYPTLDGKEQAFKPKQAAGVQEEVRESLRDLIREQLAATFPERQPARTTTRESVRPGAAVGYDHEGNPVYRKRSTLTDPFSIPEELKDKTMDYQWIRTSTYGQEDVSNQVNHQENGWRFVPAERENFRGKFMPANYTGPIFKDGLALMERPMVLTEEARREASQAVRNQSQAQRAQFGMPLPQGFSAETPAARAHTFARQGKVEATPSNLRPNHSVGSIDID